MLASVNKAAISICVQFLCGHQVSTHLGFIPIAYAGSGLVHERGMSFVLLCVSLVFVTTFCCFQGTHPLPLWLFPKHFILFDAIVNRIVFVISFWACLWLVYRKPIDFCVLILYLQLC